MRIVCDKCGTKYKVSDSQLSDKGKSAKCLKCGATIVIQTKTSKKNDLNKETSPKNVNKIIPKVIPKNCGDCRYGRYFSEKSVKQYCTFYQKETYSKSPCYANEILRARKAAKMMADNAKIYNRVKESGTIDVNTPVPPSQPAIDLKKMLLLLIFLCISIAVLNVSTNKTDNKNVDTKARKTLAEQYPGPWMEDAKIDIVKTLAKNNIKGCGSFVYRAHYLGGFEYLVRCDGYNQGKLYLALTGTRVVLTVDPDGSL